MLGWGKLLAGIVKLFNVGMEYMRNQQLLSAGRAQQKAADYEKVEELRREEQKIKDRPDDDKSTVIDELLGNNDDT